MSSGAKALQEERETACDNQEPAAVLAARSQLLALDEEQLTLLRGIIASYVQSMGLVAGDSRDQTAREILQEAIVEALAHADHFDPNRQIKAWLLGIALNIIRHKKAEAAKRRQREFSFSQLARVFSQPMSDDDVLDSITLPAHAGPEEQVESAEQVDALLSLVSVDDQQILRLAFLEDFAREALARQLGVTEGAARVRLHRALARLRAAWIAQQRGEEHERAV